MPAEWQRRTLDAPSQQPVTEIAVNTPQAIKVDGVLIKPYDLHDFVLAGGAMSGKEALVHQREPIVQPRIAVGFAAAKGCTCETYPVAGGDTARDGGTLSRVGPIHRM